MKNYQNNIDVFEYLNYLDFIVFFSILFLTFYSIYYGIKKKDSMISTEKLGALDYLLMGRKLSLPFFVATLVATWYGGIFGVTKNAFDYGIYNFLTQGVFWYVTYIIFALFLVAKIKKHKSITLAQLVGEMFGTKSKKIAAVFNFINVIPVSYTIGIGIFLQAVFGGNLIIMSGLGVSVVAIYSMFGGFRSVVYSDIIQFYVMCISVVLVILYSFSEFGGYSFLNVNLKSSYFSLTGGQSLFTVFMWGFIALSTLVDPNFYQRCFAAKDTKTARNGILISTVIWFCFDICTTAGAMYAKAVIPSAESKFVYLTYSIQVLPHGLRGFFIAGILATILSTLDSYIFSASTTLSFDILSNSSIKKYKIDNHIYSIFVVVLSSLVLASFFDGNIKLVWKILGSYSAACLFMPLIFGFIFPNVISDNVFTFTAIASFISVTYWQIAEHRGFFANIDALYIGMLCSLVILVIGAIYSKVIKKNTDKIQ